MMIQRVSDLFRLTHAHLIPGFELFLSTSETALLHSDLEQVSEVYQHHYEYTFYHNIL